MATFFGINKEVLPLKANLAVQEAKYNVAMTDLNNAQAQLDEKEAELAVVCWEFALSNECINKAIMRSI